MGFCFPARAFRIFAMNEAAENAASYENRTPRGSSGALIEMRKQNRSLENLTEAVPDRARFQLPTVRQNPYGEEEKSIGQINQIMVLYFKNYFRCIWTSRKGMMNSPASERTSADAGNQSCRRFSDVTLAAA